MHHSSCSQVAAPSPNPTGGIDGVAHRDLHRLQPLCDIIQQLLRGGLTGAGPLQTFFSYRVQLLH
jgi:hypothetical protein